MSVGRRAFLLALAAPLATSLAGCAAKPPTRSPAPPPPLRVLPLTGLVPSAGLRWLVIVRPAELFGAPDLIAPLARLVPNGGLDLFRETTGVELRTMPSALVAGFDRSTLYLGAATFDPTVVETKFRERLLESGPRLAPRPDLVRLAGRIGSSLDTLLLLGRDAVAVAVGDSLPVRAVEAYTLGRLRAPPALAAPPLAGVAARLGDAPVLAFAPGPFEGEWAEGVRGLLHAATAVGLAIRLTPRAGLHLTAVVAGDFARDPTRAGDLLLAAFRDLAESPLGRLAALDTPRTPPTVTPAEGALVLEVELEALPLLRGIEDAVSSQAREIFRVPPQRTP